MTDVDNLLWTLTGPPRGQVVAELLDEFDHLSLTIYEADDAVTLRLSPAQADDLENALRGWRVNQ